MLWVLKAQFVSNFTNGFTLVKDSFLGHINHFSLYVFLSCSTGFFFYEITKVAGGKI